jgi:O-antigen/teichoic acid export membrane protein
LVADALVGDLAGDVSRALVPLAIVTPLAFAGFVGTMALAASDSDRHMVLVANAAGGCLNLVLAVILVRRDGAAGAALASAVGLGVAQTIILVRLVMLGHRLRRSQRAATEPTPQASVY